MATEHDADADHEVNDSYCKKCDYHQGNADEEYDTDGNAVGDDDDHGDGDSAGDEQMAMNQLRWKVKPTGALDPDANMKNCLQINKITS